MFNILTKALQTSGEKLIEKRTARELLVGRQVKMIFYLDKVMSPLKSLGISVPEFGAGPYKMHNSSFGFLSQRINTDFGPFEIYTKSSGEDDSGPKHRFTEIYRFNEAT